MKKRVGVVFGGRSVEHEVSVITGLQVIENIDKSKYEVIPIYIDKDGKWLIGDSLSKFENFKNKDFKGVKEVVVVPNYNNRKVYLHPEKTSLFSKKILETLDVIFPAVHGTNGEDGTLQGLFELMNIPYVGGSVLASSVGMDKVMMKSVFKSYELPMVDYIWFYRNRWEDKEKLIEEIEKTLGYPVFVKPANLGSSIGISKAKNREDLIKAVEVAIRYDRKIIVEKGVEKPREINCSVIGYDDRLKTSVCEEPVGWEELLSFEDKYIKSNTKGTKNGRRIIPANIPDDIRVKIEELAKRAFMAIDCRGIARIDFLLDDKNNIYVNEINTMPGSIAYYLWEPKGISFKELIDELIEIAIKSYEEKNKNMYSYDVNLFNKIDFQNKCGKM